MPSPLQEILIPDALKFDWVEHDSDIKLGNYLFPAALPVPLPELKNGFVRLPWLQVPFGTRPPISTGLIEDDDEMIAIDLHELLEAFIAGHLPDDSTDFYRLLDVIARSMLTIITFGDEISQQQSILKSFSEMEKGSKLYEVLIHRAKGNVFEGSHLINDRHGDEALSHYIIARVLYAGAFAISPSTNGIPYDIGVLCFDLAHHLQVVEGDEQKKWQQSLANESHFFLLQGMADKEIREKTPSYFLVAVNRETLGDKDGALNAFRKFLQTNASEKYADMKREAEEKIALLGKTE